MMQKRSQPATHALVELKHVTKTFATSRGELVACADINLTITRGRSVGLVGESGSGKSTLMRVLQLLLPATSGEVWLDGVDVSTQRAAALKRFRRTVQAVAQDPFGSLFPHFTVAQNIIEPLRIHRVGRKSARAEEAMTLMEAVGLSLDCYYSHPHELSGGQQQRVAIARALALEPQLLVLDEAVSSLDVSIQAQILNLLQKMKEKLGLTYAFISHNLAVVRLLCEETAVMYMGRIVERGDSEAVFRAPLHPYTRSLVASIPAFTSDGVKPLPLDMPIGGERPSPTNLPQGCAYHTRCPLATDVCRQELPPLRAVANRQTVACHHVDKLA